MRCQCWVWIDIVIAPIHFKGVSYVLLGKWVLCQNSNPLYDLGISLSWISSWVPTLMFYLRMMCLSDENCFPKDLVDVFFYLQHGHEFCYSSKVSLLSVSVTMPCHGYNHFETYFLFFGCLVMIGLAICY